MFQLAPSLLAADFCKLGDQVTAVTGAGVEVLHIDVMDGHFVPNLTMGPDMVRSLKRHTSATLDVHLMVTDPAAFVDAFADAGAHWISFHMEAGPHPHRVCQQIKARGCSAGIVLNPATPVSQLEEIIAYVDFVLLMSVNPGFGGQQFIPATYQRLARLRALIAAAGRTPFIQVDGGIGPDNIAALVRAGMNVAVAGSSVFGKPDPALAARELIDIAEAANDD